MIKNLQIIERRLLQSPEVILSFLFFFIVLYPNLKAQEYIPDTLVWKGESTLAYETYKKGDLEKAGKLFDELTSTVDFKYHGFYGLGMIELSKDSTSEAAYDLFTKVIRMPNNRRIKYKRVLARSYYQLGHIEFAEGDTNGASNRWEEAIEANKDCLVAWLELGDLEILEDFPSEFGVDIYGNILRLGGFKPEYYEKFLEVAYWYGEEEYAVDILNQLYTLRNRDRNVIFDIVEFTYRTESFNVSIGWLDTLSKRNKMYSSSKAQVMYAKNYFGLFNSRGYYHYNKALEQIKDSSDANFIYQDVYYIMKEEEFDKLQSTSLDSLYLYYKRFWLARDPNKATNQNERIMEHFNRLLYAQNNYRKFTRSYSKKEAADDLSHPMWSYSQNISGEKLLSKYLPKMFTVERDLDDMGIIYIKHGEPDYILPSANVDLRSIENTTWQYFETSEYDEMLFHFARYSGNRGWKLQLLPVTFDNRSVLGGHYAFFDPMSAGAYKGLDPSNERYLTELADYVEQSFEYAAKNEKSSDKQKELKFDLRTDLLSFKAQNGYCDIYLYYGLEGGNIKLNEQNQLVLNKFLGVYDENFDEVIRVEKEKTLQLSVPQNVWKTSSIMQIEKMKLKPGKFNFEFQIKDMTGKKKDVLKTKFTNPNYYSNNLILSDLILSKPITGENKNNKFTRKQISYYPHMFKGYNQEYELGLYFEVYNLQLSAAKTTDFDISLMIKEKTDEVKTIELDISKIEDDSAIKMTNEYKGKSADDMIFLNLDIESLDEGTYELFVLAMDKNSESEFLKKTTFTIVED